MRQTNARVPRAALVARVFRDSFKLSAAARSQLVRANLGFDAEPRLADLERAVAVEVVQRDLTVSPKGRRAAHAAVYDAAALLETALAALDAKSRVEIEVGLYYKGLAFEFGLLGAERIVSQIRAASSRARHGVPSKGGHPSTALRESWTATPAGSTSTTRRHDGPGTGRSTTPGASSGSI